MEILSSFFVGLGESLAHFWLPIAVIGITLGTAAAAIPVTFKDSHFKRVRDWAVKPGLAARYLDLVTIGLHAAKRFYGPSRGLSWRGYGVSLFLAFVYPLFLWHLAWALDGPATLAGENVFGETALGGQRWLGLAVIWIALLVFGLVLSNQVKSENSLLRRLARSFRPTGLRRRNTGRNSDLLLRASGAVVKVAQFLAGSALVVGVVGGALLLMSPVHGLGLLVTSILVLAGAAALLGGAALSVFLGGAVLTVIAGRAVGAVVAAGAAGAVGAGFAAGAVGAVVYLTVVIIVPVANALLDHVSVQVTRWLLSGAVARRGATRQRLIVAGHIAADIIAAGFLLVVLSAVLPAVLELANRAFESLGWPLVEWRVYLAAAQREPFGAGLLVTAMLATTLIPTALHLLAVGSALVLPQVGGASITALADKVETSRLDRLRLAGLIAFSVFLSWVMLVVVGVGLWEASEAVLGPLGGRLVDVAESVGRAVGGLGAPGP